MKGIVEAFFFNHEKLLDNQNYDILKLPNNTFKFFINEDYIKTNIERDT